MPEQIKGTISEFIEGLTGISPEDLCCADGSPAPSNADFVRMFIAKLEAMAAGRPSICMGHNIGVYDFPLLYGRACAAGIDLYAELKRINVVGLLDTLWLCQQKELVDFGPEPPANLKLGTLHDHQTGEELVGKHRALPDAIGNCRVLAGKALSTALFDHSNQIVVSLGQHANRARVFRYTRKDAQPAKRTVGDILAAVDHFLERAEDGARLQVDWLRPTSEDQNSFFRAQVHNHCKALVPPVMTVTEGRIRDPGVRGQETGGYVTVINTVRTISV